MCHVLLAMPVIGLLAFVFLPWPQALAVYLPIAIVSIGFFYLIYKSMKEPATVGLEGIVGGIGEVISRPEWGQSTRYQIHYKGELWTAKSCDDLAPGEQVRVVSLDGIELIVERAKLEQ